ncbi:MAG: pyrroline-5-carboxylate reductase [Candidatus Omnitrophica bacterium]|nr:pyrroline-5-carboxylate reductase [Candidatus Omnitrophota bacterium]
MKKRVGIIGCGNMGTAILKAVAKSPGHQVTSYDIDKKRLKDTAKKYKIKAAKDIPDLVKKCDIIVLAVKPKDIEEVLSGARYDINTSKILISVAAGVTTASIESVVQKKIAIVRAMPNMPALIQAGISAVCRGRFASDKDLSAAKELFKNIGEVVEVEEDAMNAVTAISGSGPAYFFFLVEILIKMGRELGLKDGVAAKLAVETILGSARLLKETGESPEALRSRVTSKGGTTEAAFKIFLKNGLEEIIKNGIREGAKHVHTLKFFSGGRPGN